MLKLRQGQSVLEYAILMVIVIAALLSLQVYIKRGLQGRLKSSTDEIGDGYSQAQGANYVKVTYTRSNTTEDLKAGTTMTTMRKPTFTQSNATIGTNTEGEYWGH